jgi:hypothetical protein
MNDKTTTLRPSVEPWITSALMAYLDPYDIRAYPIWVPNCGQGHIVDSLYTFGAEIVATDANLSDFDTEVCDCAQMDFLTDVFQSLVPEEGSLICMPPATELEEYMNSALNMDYGPSTVALLMPSMAKHKYPEYFQNFTTLSNHVFSLEIVLTTKPHLYFYSWIPKEAKKVAKLDYSWFVWHHSIKVEDRFTPTMVWEGKYD